MLTDDAKRPEQARRGEYCDMVLEANVGLRWLPVPLACPMPAVR